MSKVTCINVLLDARYYIRNSREMNYVFGMFRNKLEQLNGVDLYLLMDDHSNDDLAGSMDNIEILTLNSCFEDIDVFISFDSDIPDGIKKCTEITKYTVVHNFLADICGTYKDVCSENIKKYQDNFDYLIVFSNKIKKMFLNKTVGMNPDRILCIPLSYSLSGSPDPTENRAYFTGNKKYCLAFYQHEYYNEMVLLAKGFIQFLENCTDKECDLVFALAYLDDGDWSYKRIAYLFEGYEDYFVLINASEESDRHQIIYEADAYLDVFYLQDINITLLEELFYDRYIVSNSLLAEHEKIINASNSVLAFKNAVKDLYRKLHQENTELHSDKKDILMEEDTILDILFETENRKRETPLVTIITITYNLIHAGRKDTIQQCIRSVHNQTYRNIEHIIIDGASDDGTLQLLDKYRKKGWIDIYSEPDDGLYDAMNKGIYRAKGKYIAFLNSDDFYHDLYGVEKTICALQKQQADYAFSDTNILNEDGSVYFWAADIRNILYARNYCHQSMFIRLDLIKELNGFDLNYKVSSDSDLMIRLYAKGYTFVNVPYCFVTYRGGGLSAASAEESRRDHSQAFFIHLGEKYGFTKYDCYELWQYRFFEELSKEFQIRLISKIPECFHSEMIINEYIKRKQGDVTFRVKLKRLIAQKVSFDGFLISRKLRICDGKQEMTYYLCKVLPIWVTKEK